MCRLIGQSRAAYLRQLIDTATLKTAGSLPIFAKRYQGAVASRLHAGIIYGLRGVELAGGRRLVRDIPVPDLIDPARHPELRVVIKSVSSRGRARLFAEALPGSRIFFIVRDPWGQVASMLRGAALGMFEAPIPAGELLATEQAKRYGLTQARFDALPVVEQFAWNWAILNEKAIDDLVGIETVKVLRYHDLCEQPMREAKELLAFADLAWDAQTERFIERSTTFNGSDRYYRGVQEHGRGDEPLARRAAARGSTADPGRRARDIAGAALSGARGLTPPTGPSR